MDQDPDGIILGGAALSDPKDDPDGIILPGGGASASSGGAAPGRRVGRPRGAPRTGRFLTWLVADAAGRPSPETGDEPAPTIMPGPSVFGVGLCWWTFQEGAADNAEHQELLEPSDGRRVHGLAWGAAHYKFEDTWPLSEAFPVPAHWWDLQDALTPTLLFDRLRAATVETDASNGRTVEEVLDPYADEAMVVLEQSWNDTERCLTFAMPHPVKSVRLAVTVPWNELVVGHPRQAYVKRWKRDCGAQRAGSGVGKRKAPEPPSFDDLVLEMPKGKKVVVPPADDPSHRPPLPKALRLIRAVNFSDFLKSQKDFSKALGAANAYDNDVESDERDASRDPGEATLRRTMSKLDILDCLLWRRKFHAARMLDVLFSVNFFTDSSPVSGHELQGLVMDIWWSPDTGERVTMPGTSLAYGLFDATNKAIGLLHSLWLLTGPHYDDVWYVCTKVVSVTTDMGVEVGTLTMPNVVLAYCQYMAGTPFDAVGTVVDRSSRWLPHALRIGGWGHAWGNLAKAVADKHVAWPRRLEQMRELVSFWRVETWRTHIRRMLQRQHVPDAELAVLQRFGATMAKWRYQTIALSMEELRGYRTIAERHMTEAWFSNAQDRESLKAVFDACRDESLWRFLEVAHRECFGKMELCRHWGMVCNHAGCKQLRDQGQKHVACFSNSRRLDEAWEFVETKTAEWKARANALTDEDCEGDGALRNDVTQLLRHMASMPKKRFKYLDDPPWCAAKCESVAGSQAFILKVESRPLEDHDPLTRDILHRVGDCIRKRSRGEDLDPALERECKRLQTTPLDESAGEGYHAAANRELKRADASKTIHLKQRCRRKGTMVHIKQFARKYGARGNAVITYEFENWKRILQGSFKRRFKGVKRRTRAVLQKVYREDDDACLNWQNIVAPETEARPTIHESAGNTEACENEYIRAQMQPGQHYSCSSPRPATVEGTNSTTTVMETRYFQFLDVAWGSSRPKLISTVSSADDVALTAPLAIEILPHAVRARDPDDPQCPEGTVELYPEGDSQWIVPKHLASFKDFQKHLQVWRRVERSPHEGCEVWSQAESGIVKFSVLDDKCPTYAIIMHLQVNGWQPMRGRQDHTRPVVGPFDCVEAIKFKQYYQVLAVISRCLPLTSHIPSRQCINFYRCLLQGLRVEPDQSSKEYKLVINAHKRKKGEMTELLPIEDIPCATPLAGDPDGIILGGAEQPLAVPEPKRQPAVATGSKRSKAAPKSLPLPAPVPIHGGPVPVPGEGGSAGSGGSGGAGGGGCPPAPDPDGIVVCRPVDPDGIVVPPAPAAPRRKRTAAAARIETGGLFGTVVMYQPYKNPDGGEYPNFTMYCSRHNPPCVKTKGMTPTNVRAFGNIEPLCFLHAWNGYDDPEGKKTHGQANPPPNLVADIAAEHGSDMRYLMDCFGLEY